MLPGSGIWLDPLLRKGEKIPGGKASVSHVSAAYVLAEWRELCGI